MRNTLQRRLAQLERRAGITGPPQITLIVHRIVKPNGQFGGDDEPVRAEANGRVWHREASETRKHFERRVEAEVLKQNHDQFIPTLIYYPAEEGDAESDA
jgi:hypothetical protein